MNEYFTDLKRYEEECKLNYICLILQQNQILKMQQVLIHQNLDNLKFNVDKLDIDKLKNTPTTLSNWESKVDKSNFDKLIPIPVHLSKLTEVVKTDVAKKAAYDPKIKHIEDKTPNITNLATNATLNAKNTRLKDHDHDKYITNKELTLKNFSARPKQANLASKSDIANFVKTTDFDNKLKSVTSNRNELNELSN